MPVNNTATNSASTRSTVGLVLNLARTLHRNARSASRAMSLPVLRRVIATSTLRDIRLPQLYRHRDMVQRKHILRTLAVEAGFASREHYRPALASMTPAQLVHFELAAARSTYPNIWFSSHAEAIAHAAEHGGEALPVGKQALVIPLLST